MDETNNKVVGTRMEDLPDFVRQRIDQLRSRTGASKEELMKMYIEIFTDSKEIAEEQFPTATAEELLSLRQRYSVGKLWIDIINYPGRVMTKESLEAVKINREKLQKYKGDWIDTFYTSKEWEELRHIVLVRDEYRCRVCSSEEGVAAHHIVPRVYIKDVIFYIDSLDNLLTLCDGCHPKADRKEEPSVKRSRRRFR